MWTKPLQSLVFYQFGFRAHNDNAGPLDKNSLKKVSGEAAKRQRNVAAKKLPSAVTVR
jgi:hypothetical protein